MSTREATEKWISEFNSVPGSVIEKLAQSDELIHCYDSDTFRLLASPKIECSACSASYEDDLTLEELKTLHGDGKGVACEYCEDNQGDEWTIGYPEYAFPCGWGTLFVPNVSFDLSWFTKHASEVAKLGFFVFESDDWGILLGIDAGGFDFHDAYWIPLYKLRGLQWHDV